MTTRASLLWLWAGIAVGAVAMSTVLLAVADVPGLPEAAGAPPRFVPDWGGVDHVYDGEFPFFVGGGVAVLDCDHDGRPDLYIAGGSNPAALYRNRSRTGGELRFVSATSEELGLTEVTGAYPLDFDGDGLVDLAVLRDGENVVLRGTGDCGFQRANEEWSIDGGNELTVAFSAKWERGAQLPTFVFANYVALGDTGERQGCSDHFLFRPEHDHGYGEPIPLRPGWCALSALFSDWGRSGRVDLRLTNDRHYYREGQEQLWRVEDGRPPRLYTADEGWQEVQIWGMGIASHDLTGDGLPEVFLTSQADNKLQTLVGDGRRPEYRDMALEAGVTAHRPYAGDVTLPSTAWHAEFQDVNNDGLVDLYIAKGNVDSMPEYAARDPNNLLLGQPDGTFVETASVAGLVGFNSTRGAALVDLNLDGMLDLVEVNRSHQVLLWRSVGWGDRDAPAAMGDWVAVRLRQSGPNRDAIGSWVEVRAGGRLLGRELTVGGGHAGGQLGWVHFGLGSAGSVEVRVQWPDGVWGPWQKAPANTRLLVDRDRGVSPPEPAE